MRSRKLRKNVHKLDTVRPEMTKRRIFGFLKAIPDIIELRGI
jgi:hypothetical protein